MNENLKPLPKKTTKEIRQILEDCQSGKLKHNQAAYHCGTSHCIAGWKVVFDYAKRRSNKVLTADFDTSPYYDRIQNFIEKTGSTVFESDYARSKWRLTNTEAYMLFGMYQTFPEQFALLEKLERGERL